jgi:hypothetical protein
LYYEWPRTDELVIKSSYKSTQ